MPEWPDSFSVPKYAGNCSRWHDNTLYQYLYLIYTVHMPCSKGQSREFLHRQFFGWCILSTLSHVPDSPSVSIFYNTSRVPCIIRIRRLSRHGQMQLDYMDSLPWTAPFFFATSGAQAAFFKGIVSQDWEWLKLVPDQENLVLLEHIFNSFQRFFMS